ncbi:MAG TPA: RNase adapter RapZ, partial [Polyangia bacterium]|nr:RNase adapter RapZ [Polyangia bacterium]
MKLVVVTGVSGAGKSTALRALEDLGYYCADNLPLPLLPKFVELLATREEIDRAALGIDARGGEFLQDATKIFADIRAAGHTLEFLYLEANDEILIRRFSETRRRHPLSDTDIRAGLVAEREQLSALRHEANAVVDTGALTVHVLRALIQERYGRAEGGLAVTLLSFGFKHGLPAEADIVLDVRFLPNPFFVPQLSAMSGEDDAVKRFVLDDPETKDFVEKAEALLKTSVRG